VAARGGHSDQNVAVDLNDVKFINQSEGWAAGAMELFCVP